MSPLPSSIKIQLMCFPVLSVQVCVGWLGTAYCHFCAEALGLRQQTHYGPGPQPAPRSPRQVLPAARPAAHLLVGAGSEELVMGTNAAQLRLLWSPFSCPSVADPLEALWDVAFLRTCL